MRRTRRDESFDHLRCDAEPPLAPGDYVFAHDSVRQHLVWQVTRSGRPIILIDGRFRALARDDYLPLAGGRA